MIIFGIDLEDWTRFEYHKQVFAGIAILYTVIGIAFLYEFLNRTPVKIESRNDQEAGFQN